MSLVSSSTGSFCGWVLNHRVGSNSFSLAKMLCNCVKANLFCLDAARQSDKPPSKTDHARSRTVLCPLVNSRADRGGYDNGIFFTCRLDGGSLSQDSFSAIDVSCRAVLGHVLYEGLSFVSEVTPVVDGPELKELTHFYQGPSLSNTYLVDVIFARNPPLKDFVAEGRTAHDFFNMRSTSPFYSGQHIPTHVANAAMTDALSQVFLHLGIDDDAALAVEAAAQYVRDAEEKAWRTSFRREFMRLS